MKIVRILKITLIGIAVLMIAAAAFIVRIDYTGHREGIYLVRDDTGALVLTDDILLGDEGDVIFGYTRVEKTMPLKQTTAARAYLEVDWREEDGSGFVRNIFPDGREIVTCFSRFWDSQHRITLGVFLGGGLPVHARGPRDMSLNETGMAVYDGRNWQHLWCTANEAFVVGTKRETFYPSQLRFIDSRLVERTPDRVILESSHELERGPVKLLINRYAVFLAGEPYFILINRIYNRGETIVPYFYLYGDEPWLGNYGSSRGNVGWAQDRLFLYEGKIDVGRYSYAGMVELGNSAIGESGDFHGLASFIEWLTPPPNLAYFSNREGAFAPESARVPLASQDNRQITLQWGQKKLRPATSDLYVLAIGMAQSGSKDVLPVKPLVRFYERDTSELLQREGLR